HRLRAGLCDRCTVTQELAKRKQQEFESSHFHSIKHITVLTNELNRLKDENKKLVEEIRRLRSLLDFKRERQQQQKPVSPEGLPLLDSSVCLLPLPNRKRPNVEMTPSRQAEQRNSEQASPQSEQGVSVSVTSPPHTHAGTQTPTSEDRVKSLKSQRISNQLHGTIAFLRSGMNNCPSEKGSNHAIPDFDFRPNNNYVLRETILSHTYTRSGKPDLHPVVSPFEDATIGNKEQLHILDHHFAQHFLKLRGFCSGLERGHGSPSDVPLTREADPKLNPQGKWDDLPPVAKFQEAMIHKHEYISRVGLQGPECKERHYHFVPKYYPIGAKLGEELFRNQSPVHSYEEKAEPMHYGNRTMTMWPKKPDDPLIAKNLKTLGQPGRLSNDSLDKPLDLSENGRERKESGSLS
uniref:DNA endonuclease Ctp1 N-terminal domain-containing protein n=1 Tax=Latimeria chalumnae TaxID=7897 RepID=H3B0B1_LATCH